MLRMASRNIEKKVEYCDNVYYYSSNNENYKNTIIKKNKFQAKWMN